MKKSKVPVTRTGIVKYLLNNIMNEESAL